ncbi:MAG: carbohydrate ABC transporter permease [Christensenellales bacterium]|jgi:putative aldouronate transport system permease protein
MRRTKRDVVFDTVNVILLILITFLMIYPLYFTVLASVSNFFAVQNGDVLLWPVGFTLEAYQNVFRDSTIWRGYVNSIIYTVLGTIYNVSMTVCCAYGLSRPGLKGKGILNFFFVFTMYFGGGLIPSYLLIKDLGMINTLWVMIIPNGMGVFNMIITRTFYRSNFSNEIYEAAKIDGATEFRIFFSLALPLSGAIIAVMALYNGVGVWNSWFGGLLYITSPDKFPLALVLRTILTKFQDLNVHVTSTAHVTAEDSYNRMLNKAMQESMRYALIFISSAPVLMAYPFVQRHFVKGVMIGSLKG